jgi:hypothetical protein
MNPMIIDIEISPVDYESYSASAEEDRTDFINPVDSRIIGIGIRYSGNNEIIIDDDEKKILIKFWMKYKEIKEKEKRFKIAGFNISQFDIPFITSRCFINKVPIIPFVMKDILDIREKINAYRYGKTRGRLTEYARLIDIPYEEIDSSLIFRYWNLKDIEKIKANIDNKLSATAQLFKRLIETNIIRIEKW